jgi:hypothetical protein
MIYTEPFRFFRDVYDVLFMNLRESDIEELESFTGDSPQEALSLLIQRHDVLRLIKDDYGRTLGIFGVVPSFEHSTQYKKVGEIFFLATDELFEKYKPEFLRKAPRVLKKLLHVNDYDVVYNYTTTNNKKWLEFLGFDVYETEVFFKNPRRPFYYFMLERS